MRRPLLVTVVMVLQLLLGLLLTGLTVYLLALTRSRETLTEPDAAGTIHGLLIGAMVLGVPAVITLVAVLGLWKQRFWGWVLALATDVGMISVFAYSMIDERDLDRSESAVAAGFLCGAVLLLLPGVRKFYWNAASSD